jgi:aminoglycoside 2''-phosphotransferase
VNARHLRTVIETCFPAFSVQSISFLAEGWSSTVWDVNGTHVFRFPKRPAVAPGLLKEMSLLPILAPALPLAIPRLEFAWRGGPAYEGVFVGYPKIAGGMLTERHWSEMAAGAAPSASPGAGGSTTAECPGLVSRRIGDAAAAGTAARPLARQLGAFLTALHGFPLQRAIGAGIPDGTPAAWRRQCQSLYESARERVFPLLDAPTRRAVDTRWAGFLTSAAILGFAPVLIHGDLATEHILCDPSLATLTGVIDWEDASIGDPALDFAGLLATLGTGAVEEVLSSYGGIADTSLVARARFYGAVGPFHEVLYGLETGLKEHVSAGLRAVRAAWR